LPAQIFFSKTIRDLDGDNAFLTLRGEFCMQYADQREAVKPVVPRAGARYASCVQAMQERSIALDDGHLNCAVGPENGPPLVLWHGVTRCWRDFAPILAELMASWQVWAIDHRGHGRSSRGPAPGRPSPDVPPFRVLDFAQDALSFVDTALAGSPPAVLLGHSLGAMVAALVAAQRPDRVRALVLEDPPGSTLGPNVASSRFHLQFTNTLKLFTEMRPHAREMIQAAGQQPAEPAGGGLQAVDVESLAGVLAAMPVQRPQDGAIVPFQTLRDWDTLLFTAECLRALDPRVLETLTAGSWLHGLDWFSHLPRISCPTLVLRADPDAGGMLAAAEAARIRTLIPRCTVRELPGVGHSIHTREPQRMLAMIQEFLQSQLNPNRVRP
jgi:pimeloyl-ACP methyl ester carboxylesterase